MNMPRRTAAALLLVTALAGCATDSGPAVVAATPSETASSPELKRGLECDGGYESAHADYFPNAPHLQSVDEGDVTPELAALQLLTFGRTFDTTAYEADTSQAGRVTYSSTAGAVVADVVVVTTPGGKYVATEMQVCKSALAPAGQGGGDRTMGTGAPKPSPSPDVTFEVAYDPAAYDPELAEPALTRCAELPGAARADFQMDSQPPIDVVTFKGSGSAKQTVDDCLRLVPAARVSIR